jgi:hypothetical protein
MICIRRAVGVLGSGERTGEVLHERETTMTETQAQPTQPTAEQAKSRWPTRKWLVTQITAVAALLTAWVTAGAWDKTLSVALIGLFAQATVGYLVPNADTPGGVPLRKQA